ncbi:Rieske (2Fe-2S) iron-sulfur domain protein [Desulfobulbus propionicus DSM 2032]|jgi:cytochrome b6-f complex iron-sulfur subunit|uniref:Rieske (2Fe-2S) iron-sulfur domain protein n=1 Tax=Desulfobulbus propionicus (strain ATCC 33891 / DSM 2032 / VKM B-1956 / 1pr3) TaxID=577650 RepID=A0A7U3YNM0_DESPD|nr:ubiquinol-cytochrome c reductase iron-sulfur subunit [Desulfobulbus propionicus]ADW18677.1 Rieske (2Fe-2S) iron-sulfur domain protein [Desulfobulbus propionicus DSM 2032]
MNGPLVERRTFIGRGMQWLAAVVSAAFLYPLLRFTGHRIPRKPRLVEVAAPLPLTGVYVDQDFLLLADPHKAEGAMAVSRICTHLGCRVNYQQDKQLIECPCHQSRFTLSGQRISGPAEKDLPVHEVTVNRDADGRVVSYVVTI